MKKSWWGKLGAAEAGNPYWLLLLFSYFLTATTIFFNFIRREFRPLSPLFAYIKLGRVKICEGRAEMRPKCNVRAENFVCNRQEFFHFRSWFDNVKRSTHQGRESGRKNRHDRQDSAKKLGLFELKIFPKFSFSTPQKAPHETKNALGTTKLTTTGAISLFIYFFFFILFYRLLYSNLIDLLGSSTKYSCSFRKYERVTLMIAIQILRKFEQKNVNNSLFVFGCCTYSVYI